MYDFLLTQSKALEQLGGLWVIALLVFVRILAFASLAPLIGHKGIPGLVKVSFAMLLTLILLPNLPAPQEYPKDFLFVYLIAMNACAGLLIGWLAQLMIEMVKAAGEMLDMQMALHAATIFDPGTQSQTTLIGRYFDFIALILFISIGGMEKLIEALNKSFTVFPVVLYELNIDFAKILEATASIISIGFLIASPIIITILCADLILGLMSRAAPQINAFQVSFSIKPALGLLLIFILLPALFQALASWLGHPTRFMF